MSKEKHELAYKGSHGKIVRLRSTNCRDLHGNLINTSLYYVITWYIDNDAEVVGIYPINKFDGYALTKEEILSVQPMRHEVFIQDLIEIN